MITNEQVILVTPQNEEVGTMEKMEAHRTGVLHRAFSIFVFNEAQEMLIHKRAEHKYHSPGLWTNTCCSHPRPGETVMQAAERRLNEEMGFQCALNERFHFIYKADLEQNLIEHELDFVLTGIFAGTPQANAEEVSDWKFVSIEELMADVEACPEAYTVWFRIALPRVLSELKLETTVLKAS